MKFAIIRKSSLWLILGGLLMIGAWVMFFTNFQLSVEFTGGIDMKVTTISGSTETAATVLTTKLQTVGYKDAKVRVHTTDVATNLLVTLTMKDDGDAKKVADALKTALIENKYIATDADVLSQSLSGPSISGYMKQMTGIAILVGLLGMIIYMFFSFASIRKVIPPVTLALMTVATMIFDISVPAGFYGLWMMINPTIQVDSVFVLVLLTIMGYSINDTIIIFDRIRENAKKVEEGLSKGTVMYATIFENSLWQTMRRSIGTSTATFLAVVAMYVFGTDVIQRFSYTMGIGIICGTYSSIFIGAGSAYLLLGRSKKEFAKIDQQQKNPQKGIAQKI